MSEFNVMLNTWWGTLIWFLVIVVLANIGARVKSDIVPIFVFAGIGVMAFMYIASALPTGEDVGFLGMIPVVGACFVIMMGFVFRDMHQKKSVVKK